MHKSVSQIRKDFPFISSNGSGEIYFDNGATTQKPLQVIQDMQEFYLHHNANVHRSSHQVALSTSDKFEQARKTVARFIGARCDKEVIWTRGCTDSINLLCTILSKSVFQPGQSIVVSELEHHANIVPWQEATRQYGLTLKVIPVNAKGVLELEKGLSLLDEQVVLLAIGHVSNALGNINPLQPLIQKAKECGALTFVDGAQAVAHLEVNVTELDCDFYAFSSHKMYGPTGIGVLYGRQDLLEKLPPAQFGGEMVKKVSFSQSEYQDLPFKFEAGTPNVQGVLGLASAVSYIEKLSKPFYTQHEQQLRQQLITGLKGLSGVTLWGDLQQGISTVSFSVNDVHAHDIGTYLSQHNIAVRVGHHCAMPLMQALGVEGTIRASLGCYNTQEEVKQFLSVLSRGLHQLRSEGHKQFALEENEHPQAMSVNKESNPSIQNFPLADQLRTCRGWDQTYRQIMLSSKAMERPNPSIQQSRWEVQGCESRVWIAVEMEQGRLQIKADSASKVIRGLLAILLEAINHQPVDIIKKFDLDTYFSELGLTRYLSESRGNGLKGVMKRIVLLANKFD